MTLLHEYHARLGAALEGDNRLAAVEKLHAEREARIEPMAQAGMFPAGDDLPMFTLPEDPDDQHLNCIGCNRHPAESGRATWQPCDRCGAPVCDTCYYDDYNGEGHYCSLPCANYNNPDRPLE